jgi:exoribonuclease R
MNRVSTVYLPDKKYNMLPNIYADNIASLLEDKNRYSLSLILKTNKKEIISYNIYKKIIKNIKNYDYDNFDKIYKKNINLKEFVEYSRIFFNLDSFDSHKLVENWMIIANKLTATYLIENNIKYYVKQCLTYKRLRTELYIKYL